MKSVLNAFRVLEEVAARQPARVSDLAKAMDMPKSSVHRVLTTLCEAGWLRPTGGELPRYVLTSRALTVGRMASSENGLREAALPVMVWLRDATLETIHLSVRDGDSVVLVERVDSEQTVRTYNPLGVHAPLHASASGKAVLALLPPNEVERVFAAGLTEHTDRTLVDEASLRADLAATRKRGYALNRGEWRREVAAVAAAICGEDGVPIGAINVSAPVGRTSDRKLKRSGALLLDARDRIETALGARPLRTK